MSVGGSYLGDLLPGFLLIAVGLGFSFVPISIAALAGVQQAEAGLASGLINTTNQLGMALGLGLVSVVFFGAMDEPTGPQEVGPAFAGAFENAMWWVIAILGVVYALLFALPKRNPADPEPEKAAEPEQKEELVAV